MPVFPFSTLNPLNEMIYIFTHLKLCVATATHNFKWAKNPYIWWIWD